MTWGPWQIFMVLALALLLFGGKKLPDLAHALGKSLGEFKKGKEEGDRIDSGNAKRLEEAKTAETGEKA